ncbi:MAG: PD-(D/E)XK nuclease family protein [Verrucomicrobiota bacterium]
MQLELQFSTKPDRVFLGWARPLVDLAVARLTEGWDETGLLDLSERLIIVPSRQAGRRLREALAVHTAKFNAAVLPPLVVTPSYLVSVERLPGREGDHRSVTSARSTQLLWTALLMQLPLENYRRLFPVDPVDRSLRWAADTAAEILEVRNLLTEAGHSLDSASSVLGAEGLEAGRWEDLAKIEAKATSLGETCGLRDEAKLRVTLAERATVPEGIRQIEVIGVPDLKPLAASILEALADQLSVAILIQGPSSLAKTFDDFGRPLAGDWLERELPIPFPKQRIHRAINPTAQASIARRLVSSHAEPSGCAAIGLPDPELAAPIERHFAEVAVPTYNPAGESLRQSGIYFLLKTLADAFHQDRFRDYRTLLNLPYFGDAARRAAQLDDDRRVSLPQLQRLCDDLILETLPGTLGEARAGAKRRFSASPELTRLLDWMASWRDRFRGGDFSESLTAFLIELHADSRLQTRDPLATSLREIASAFDDLQSDLVATAPAFRSTLTSSDQFQLLLSEIASARLYKERDPGAVELQGWLELAWEDAPHLIVTGMNDDFVPESIIGHAYLPDSARTLLGVEDNAAREARDRFLFSALLASRAEGDGRVDLIFGRETSGGDPLRPSRLLFQCSDAELPERTLFLFGEEDTVETPVARTVAFPLVPRPLPSDHRVFETSSPSALKTYLRCPFRFYLNYGLKMEPIDITKREMDAADFGNLVHHALESLVEDSAAAASSDPDEIKDYLHAAVDRLLRDRFGKRLTTPLVVQREAARKRLAWWAPIEGYQREEGWEIKSSEEAFGSEGWPFELSGITIRGRIDRIDHHPEHGFRVIDFKTLSPMQGGKLRGVAEYHLSPLKKADAPEDFPEWQLVEHEGTLKRWTDLQIPLYRLAMASQSDDRAESPITCGYATLGKSEPEVRLDLWEDLDAELLESARRCAIGALESIRSGRFWPPMSEPPPRWDPYSEILGADPSATIDPALLATHPD